MSDDLEFLLRRSVELREEKATSDARPVPTVEDFNRQAEELYCSGKEGTVEMPRGRIGSMGL